ncbi:MAG TPA: hypothetical protein VKG02_03020, partial [Blastocatellia bacterium]|nr:hypothetical protein [Blastocatellia bacterium]
MKAQNKLRNFALFGSGALLLATGANWLVDGADTIGVKQARELIQNIAGANLTKDQVQIKNISGGVGGGGVVVDAQIETAFRLTKGKDGWRVTEAR